MKGLSDSIGPPILSAGSSSGCTEKELASEAREQEQAQSVLPKASLWSSFVASTFSVFEPCSNSSAIQRSKGPKAATSGWTEAVRRAVASSPMRRLQERILGPKLTGTSASGGSIWLLGVCYKTLPEEHANDSISSQGHAEFLQDFSSRIWLTYRKGFESINELNFTSDVGWGCMLRSGQMLVAQALVFHHLGRSWRRPIEQPFDREYLEILQCFGDSPSQSSPFSIHNLLEAGKPYGLAAGAWLGPYALCRSWEALARSERDRSMTGKLKHALPMGVYVVSGDEDGERGGAPVICIDDAARLCSDGYIEHGEWGPLLILIPLVLGLEKINPRYIPSLWATFTFPQSLGMVGGKPGASTYMVGVQDDQALYLDPHEVQQVVAICPDNFKADTSSYHCSVVRHMPLSGIDPSLALGFYCKNRDDFDDFCTRASDLANQSNGAPMFTVTQSLNKVTQKDGLNSEGVKSTVAAQDTLVLDDENLLSQSSSEDDWQIV